MKLLTKLVDNQQTGHLGSFPSMHKVGTSWSVINFDC